MNALDLLVILVVAAAAWGGYRLGFLARALSWIGMLLGLFVGIRLAPFVIDLIDDERSGLVAAAGLMILLVSSLVGQVIGLMIGTRARGSLRGADLPRIDRIAGAVVAGAGVLLMVWVVLPTLASGTSWPAELAQGSTLRQSLPEPPDALGVLREVIEPDGVTRVVDLASPDVADPPVGAGLSAELSQRVARSIVKVQSRDCGSLQTGTGFVVADDIVVTNAHVVAGADDPTVVRDDGAELDATVIEFDAGRDIAVLLVAGIDRPGLERASTQEGAIGGVFGHPGGEELRISPYRVELELTATGRDLYGEPAASRGVLLIAAQLEPGDSGAPLIDVEGRMVGMTFAVAPDDQGVAYVLDVDEITAVIAVLAQRERTPVGPCIVAELTPG